MAFFGRTNYNLKPTSVSATVPNNPTAKLMYYLKCMCTVLKYDDEPTVNRLCRYQNYFITRQERDLLIQLCILLKPDVLLNKCIFQEDALCGDSSNKFYDLEQVRNSLMIAGSVMIGGQNRRVTKIMTFKMSWVRTNWQEPIQELLERQRQERLEMMRVQTAACAIL